MEVVRCGQTTSLRDIKTEHVVYTCGCSHQSRQISLPCPQLLRSYLEGTWRRTYSI